MPYVIVITVYRRLVDLVTALGRLWFTGKNLSRYYHLRSARHAWTVVLCRSQPLNLSCWPTPTSQCRLRYVVNARRRSFQCSNRSPLIVAHPECSLHIVFVYPRLENRFRTGSARQREPLSARLASAFEVQPQVSSRLVRPSGPQTSDRPRADATEFRISVVVLLSIRPDSEPFLLINRYRSVSTWPRASNFDLANCHYIVCYISVWTVPRTCTCIEIGSTHGVRFKPLFAKA